LTVHCEFGVPVVVAWGFKVWPRRRPCESRYTNGRVHFLPCPRDAHERWALTRKVGKERKTLTPKTILRGPE
jgi:hypothetical protein